MNDIAHASHTVRGVDLNRQISEKKLVLKQTSIVYIIFLKSYFDDKEYAIFTIY